MAIAAVHPGKLVTASKSRHQRASRAKEPQLKNNTIRICLFIALVAALGVPASYLAARTRQPEQQEGPTKPTPAQQPGAAPKAPTGQQQPEQAGQPQSQAPQVSIAVQSNVVNIDAVVQDSDGNLLTGLKKQNFRVLDDNQPQQISNFSPSDAPITIVVLMEFSSRMGGYFGYRGKNWAYNFLGHMNQKDWVAFKTFDLRTNVLVDFTQDKNQVAGAIAGLYWPDFHEAVLFDAVLETLDQLRGVKGKKSILIIASGYDTFSKHTLDQTFKHLKETDTTIFAIGMGELLDALGRNEKSFTGPEFAQIDYLQAKNQMNAFAEVTGGYAWFPRFEGEMNDIFNSVAAFLRNQYTIGFTPTSGVDGKFHKLKVEVVDDSGNPLVTVDKKNHKKKVTVIARQGYTSPKPTTSGN
jgi:VWFA-related protein